MEKNSRNQTTSFLMAVGIIFIVISGTIFISTAWQYVPLYGKQCIIFVISVCLFAGAKKMEKIGQMEKTEAALYYLAVSFLGLFSLSMCGYMTQDLECQCCPYCRHYYVYPCGPSLCKEAKSL